MTGVAELPPPHEAVIAMAPFTVRRTVRWSECDPAGVVYAGKFPDYMANTVHQFRSHVLKAPVGPGPGRTYDTPGKALSMVFMGPLWPDDIFDMAVFLGGIGGSTLHFHVMATRADTGTPVFAGRISSIHVAADNRLRTVNVPEDIRAKLEDYRSRCGPAPEALDQVALPGQGSGGASCL